jgi:arabinan endo-1,5-alpha-L-arabinosidase
MTRRSASVLYSTGLAGVLAGVLAGGFAGCSSSSSSGTGDDETEGGDATPPPGDGGSDATLDGASELDGGATPDTGVGRAEGGDASAAKDAAADARAIVDAGPCTAPFGGGPTMSTTTHLDIGVHDPSMAWDGHDYFLFATGGTLNVRSSADIFAWADAGNVFSAIPSWVTTTLGANPGSLWAPDISYFAGAFHVYYAGSTFGSNTSVIGLATTPTLAQPTWTDQGLVVKSVSSDDFNAIDPNVSFDANCAPWLAFGSFWSGIKMRKLDAATGKPATDDTTTYSLASRNGGAIEAASIVSHNGFYYLFVSFDACCQGVNSTYRTMVGRGTSINGPYFDMAGTDMMNGAAEQLLATEGRYIGPGGGTAWKDGDTYLYVYHYYDGDGGGASKLQVRPIVFGADDWPTLADPLFP